MFEVSDTPLNQFHQIMPELYPLQAELLRVLEENAEKEFFTKRCRLTSEQLRKLMKPKPCSEQYISRILKALQEKGRVKISREQTKDGLKRVITIL
jgi:DNA-binding SARP family transcriptional activator